MKVFQARIVWMRACGCLATCKHMARTRGFFACSARIAPRRGISRAACLRRALHSGAAGRRVRIGARAVFAGVRGAVACLSRARRAIPAEARAPRPANRMAVS